MKKVMKVMFVFGTRPEAIKLIPIIKKMNCNDKFEIKICITAQHRNMLDQVLNDFKINVDYDLDIMRNAQTLSYIISKSLTELEKIIHIEDPNFLIVQGDTSSAFAGALAAFYNKTNVAYVEAGLRTFKKYFPFPEEMNRRLITALADIYFAPTDTSKYNLVKENVDEKKIFVTGNTSIDFIKLSVKSNYIFKYDLLNKLNYKDNKTIIVTAHRRENLGLPLQNICRAILKLSEDENINIIYPVHSNPNVCNTVYKILDGKKNIYLTSPLDVIDMHNLIARSYLVLTDSGGLQEEAPALNKPVLVLRDVTERTEGVDTGALVLVGTNTKNIIDNVYALIENKYKYQLMAEATNPFGDGRASEKILRTLLAYFDINN
jgi:UDP-N-acetylglucosamine 2-epimerase (non-hydrolysing)